VSSAGALDPSTPDPRHLRLDTFAPALTPMPFGNLTGPCPAGTIDNSPMLQRWVTAIKRQFRPEGTTEAQRVSAVPSGRISSLLTAIPTLKRWAILGSPFRTRHFCPRSGCSPGPGRCLLLWGRRTVECEQHDPRVILTGHRRWKNLRCALALPPTFISLAFG